ncbi:hypothetical protein CR513_31414, partial [Mucuna pruriens]
MGNLFSKNKKRGANDKRGGGRIYTAANTRGLAPSHFPMPRPLLYPTLEPPPPPSPPPRPAEPQSISKKPSFARVSSKQQSSSVMNKKQSANKYALILDNFRTLEQN